MCPRVLNLGLTSEFPVAVDKLAIRESRSWVGVSRPVLELRKNLGRVEEVRRGRTGCSLGKLPGSGAAGKIMPTKLSHSSSPRPFLSTALAATGKSPFSMDLLGFGGAPRRVRAP